MKENIIEVKDLCRNFNVRKKNKNDPGVIHALENISFDVQRGQVFGLLGPNGAGKTTTVKILSTLLAPTSGSAKVFGYHTFGQEKNIRKKINFIFGSEYGVYRRLTARENLCYFADLYKLPVRIRDNRIKELLDLVGLSGKAEQKVESYSKGMVQRLQIAKGLINDPEVIFLDEPSVGLDPIGARELRQVVKNFSSVLNKTVLLTTHYMHEADELCDRIAIMNHGKIIANNTPDKLKSGMDDVREFIISCEGNLTESDLRSIQLLPGIKEVNVESKGSIHILNITTAKDNDLIQNFVCILSRHTILSIEKKEPSLEEVYIRLIEDQDD